MMFKTLIFGISLSMAFINTGQKLKTWEVYERSFEAENDYGNAYKLIESSSGSDLLTAVFRGSSGNAEGLKIEITGFWDGDQTWKIRFSPPAAGTWEYETFSADAGLSGKTGTIQVSDWSEENKSEVPTRRGLVQVSTDYPNYFSYSDGTPFLWIGDTWWNWTKRSIHFSSFQNLVDDRSDKGFNVSGAQNIIQLSADTFSLEGRFIFE